MKNVQFTSCELRRVAVKIPLFESTCGYSIHFFDIPLDFYKDIEKNSLDSFCNYPLISLSFYMYIVRYRRSFLKFVNSTKTVNSNN